MAKYCDEIFGDLLLKEPLPEYPVRGRKLSISASKHIYFYYAIPPSTSNFSPYFTPQPILQDLERNDSHKILD